MDIFHDYVPAGAVPAETIEKYGHRIPKELLQIWQEKGFGTFFGGYFKVIDPSDYDAHLQECYFRRQDAIPILANPFGDLITFEKGKYITLVSIRKGFCTIMIPCFDLFLMLLRDETFLARFVQQALYDKLVERHGPLDFSECFASVPLLCLGGKESVDTMKKAKIREHIHILLDFCVDIDVVTSK